jgi:type II secretory pathway pseudopilin PulG
MRLRGRNQKGFTLIEAVVSASVFAFVMTSVLGVYLSALQIDSKTRAERAVQQNARFILEFLGKEIRNGSINYDEYGGTINYTSGYTSDLYIVNQLDEQERIFCDNSDPANPKLRLTKAEGTTDLNSDKVKVTRCAFYVSPSTNPFAVLGTVPAPPNQQPFVTVVIQLQAQYSGRNIDQAVMNLQSTFTVRDYPSREN